MQYVPAVSLVIPIHAREGTIDWKNYFFLSSASPLFALFFSRMVQFLAIRFLGILVPNIFDTVLPTLRRTLTLHLSI